MSYGKIIPHLNIDGKIAHYPVVNERVIRASSGIMFFIGIATFFTVIYTENYLLMNVVVVAFWLDFFLKSVFQPHWSYLNMISSFLVRKQEPEYVGAIQKRFAWSLGLILATVMLIGPVLMQIRGPLPITICSICLVLMWMESALGICIGCKIYGYLIKYKILKEPKHHPKCPGGVCKIGK